MANFLQYGEVECVCSDHSTRQLAMKVCAPWSIVQPVVAILLGHGFIDSLSVKQPLMAWAPNIPQERFSDSSIIETPNIATKVNAVIRERTEEILHLFSDLATVLRNPDDAIGILPMSVFVTFQFRSTYEDLAVTIGKMQSVVAPGVLELRYAFATVLAELLISSGDVKSIEFDLHNIPPVLSSPVHHDISNLALPAPASIDNLFGKNG